MRKPDFFIVGAPRCGTTAMTQYLKSHPEIFMPETKEIHFFGSDLQFPPPRVTKEDYFSCFAKAKSEKRVGEASVYYLFSKSAATEIKEFCSSPRIIIMLRNPVDMIYSLHTISLFNGNEGIENFKEALDAEEDRKQGLRIPPHAHLVQGLFYRDIATYSPQVQKYIDLFGRAKVHVIVFDDFKKDPKSTYKKVLRFLEVNDDYQPNFDVINPSKKYRSKIVQNISVILPRKFGFLVRNILPFEMRAHLKQFLYRLNTTQHSRRPLDAELRKELQEGFVDDIQRLSQLIGRDLSCWCNYYCARHSQSETFKTPAGLPNL